MKSKEIDRRVAATTERVWAGIDCTKCANCCREVRPTFSEEEAGRLAGRLKMAPQQFIESYLERTEAGDENPWRTQNDTLPVPDRQPLQRV